MPIQQSLWRLTSTAEKLQPARLDSEKQLEDFIVEHPEMLDPNWMLIGRQVQTDFKGIIEDYMGSTEYFEEDEEYGEEEREYFEARWYMLEQILMAVINEELIYEE